MRVVVDTNVLVGAVMSPEWANRQVLRRCLLGEDIPMLGNALFSEMREVLNRESLFEGSGIPLLERTALFDAFCASAEWITSYFIWRPNLRDEADNHLVELAVGGRAAALISWNARDLKPGELRFPDLRIVNPVEYLEGQKGT